LFPVCEESPQVGASHPYNVDHNKKRKSKGGKETHARARVAAIQRTQVKKRAHKTAQQVYSSQSAQFSISMIQMLVAESRRLRMFNRCLVCCSMRLGVPFIAPRQLGAVGPPFGRQFLPSAGWRTRQSGAPLDMNSARSLSFSSEADR
jgi:hypothetical protein